MSMSMSTSMAIANSNKPMPMPVSSLSSPPADRSPPSRNTTADQSRREELVLHAQGGDGGYVEISPSKTLRDVRELVLEQFDPEQLPVCLGGCENGEPDQVDAEFAFRVNHVRISTKQECHKNALELWESRAKVELVPRKRRSVVSAVGDIDNRKVAKSENVTPLEPSSIGEGRREAPSEENRNEEHTASPEESKKETNNNKCGSESTINGKNPIKPDKVFSVMKEPCTAAGDGSYSDATEDFVVEGKSGDNDSNGKSNHERDIPGDISVTEKDAKHTNGTDVAMDMEKEQETTGNTNDGAGSPTDAETPINKKEGATKAGTIFNSTSEREGELSARPRKATKVDPEKTLPSSSMASDEIIDICVPGNTIVNIQRKFRSSRDPADLKICPNTQFNNLRVYTVKYSGSAYGLIFISGEGRVVVKRNIDGKSLHPRIGSILVGVNGYVIPYRAPFPKVLQLLKYFMKSSPVTLIFAEDDHFTSLFSEDLLPNMSAHPLKLPVTGQTTSPRLHYSSSYQSKVRIPHDHTPTWDAILPRDYFQRQQHKR